MVSTSNGRDVFHARGLIHPLGNVKQRISESPTTPFGCSGGFYCISIVLSSYLTKNDPKCPTSHQKMQPPSSRAAATISLLSFNQLTSLKKLIRDKVRHDNAFKLQPPSAPAAAMSFSCLQLSYQHSKPVLPQQRGVLNFYVLTLGSFVLLSYSSLSIFFDLDTNNKEINPFQ